MEQDPLHRIEASDVIRLILQYLKEHNLNQSFQVVQQETKVFLNTVESREILASDIKQGKWDNVLLTVSSLTLPPQQLVDLYELIILELIELQERDTAKSILKQTEPMIYLKESHIDRYQKLEQYILASYMDARTLYGTESKENRRVRIAKDLVRGVDVTPSSRLLSLLGQALKWQKYQGLLPASGSFDIFNDTSSLWQKKIHEHEKVVRQQHTKISCSCDCALFSPDGLHLVTGSVDGFLEVWDFVSGKINKQLKYQADDEYMLHESAVLSLCFSLDSEFFASGSQDGMIKVWQLSTGKCVRKFEMGASTTSTAGVSCLCFSADSGSLLSGNFDHSVKLHGLKSGKTLRTFVGHTSYVNSVVFSPLDTWVISGSSDGTIRIWDTKTTDILSTFRPYLSIPPGNALFAVKHLSPFPQSTSEDILVVTQSHVVQIFSLKGKIVKTFSLSSQDDLGDLGDLGETKKKTHGHDFVSACFSAKGQYVYAGTQDGQVYVFDAVSQRLIRTWNSHDHHEILGLIHHPHRNILCTYAEDGNLIIWKP